MPLVSMKPMLRAARDGGWAVGAFNPVDYSTVKAIIRAAEEVHAPVIIQTSTKTVKYYGHQAVVSWMRELAASSPVPVALHLDHGRDLEMIKRCIETGWTSVMIDGSDLPFEQNLAKTRRVMEMAVPAGVGVEAELGEIGGVEEDITGDESRLADRDKAVVFCRELDLAAFAPAIGTAHGIYRGEPKIAFHLIEDIQKRTGTPLALHGGTGLSDQVFQRCITLGCAKVNISTSLKHEFINGFCEHHRDHPTDYEPLSVLAAQYDRVKTMVRDKIVQFGGAGKAAAVTGAI